MDVIQEYIRINKYLRLISSLYSINYRKHLLGEFHLFESLIADSD